MGRDEMTILLNARYAVPKQVQGNKNNKGIKD